MRTECVDLRDPKVGLFGFGLLADGVVFSFVFGFVLAAGEPGIVLNLFFSPKAESGLTVLDEGFDRVVEFIGLLFDVEVVLDVVVARVVVGL